MKSRKEIIQQFKALLSNISEFQTDEKIEIINRMKKGLHSISPFKNEPVDCVLWEKSENVVANDYNPNKVAPPEMKLLSISIFEDGYTQPIVTWGRDDVKEVIDGFHRNRVGKEDPNIRKRVLGYLPIVQINADRQDKSDRIAATIRHNRARGKHQVDSMSDIILELKNRNWKNERIARELGMEEDEILRLCQITGLAGLFSDEDFSKSWDIENAAIPDDFTGIEGFPELYKDEVSVRTVNTSDPDRIFHTYDKWECFKAGFYATHKEGFSKEQCEAMYASFLSDRKQFSTALKHVISEWKNSCEHYLTNTCLNRIAWLGQAAMCYATGVPAAFRSGFYLLTEEQQMKANKLALRYLNRWLVQNGRKEVTLDTAMTSRQSEIY